ncbi:predicted protein [Bathycoccus prasinos]|uniref:Uncharacterized protein n=1 Tax=Bathycoccus prasinos TaxID=41875 RepID=K8EHS2_9CHLO|nr:predicted protein [Bathycoccus prasinos]CCO17559.1 predicted protein [Bathycoccus prasinos]|eukprot:XP_007511438.1 predicted protein [Bathycoccus prasinos]
MKREEEVSRGRKKGGWFSLFFFLLEVKNVAISYVKVYTHAQILSEANFAKQRRFGVLFTQRRGVLFRTRRRQYSRGSLVVTDFEHSTGLYRAELEGLASGKDIFDHYDFTRAPKGTKESPCVVTSEMEYRVVGVTDPDDDSIVIWGRLEEGKGPMLIGDEWFVHKRVGGGGAH